MKLNRRGKLFWLLDYFREQRKRRKSHDDSTPPEPTNWQTLQNVSGWIVQGGEAPIDNGVSYSENDHLITGTIDGSNALLTLGVFGDMPIAGFPVKVTIVKWDSKITNSGETKYSDSTLEVAGASGGLNVTKPEPPYNGFPGTPFIFNIVPNDLGEETPPNERFNFSVNLSECLYSNSGDTGQSVDFDVRIEVSLPELIGGL